MHESDEEDQEKKKFHDLFDTLGDIKGRDHAKRDPEDLRPKRPVETVYELFDK